MSNFADESDAKTLEQFWDRLVGRGIIAPDAPFNRDKVITDFLVARRERRESEYPK